MGTENEALWHMRALVYRGFARTGASPALEELARELGLDEASTRSLLAELGRRHAVVPTEDGRGVLMANPFSAVPTPFRVTAGGVRFWANCAWDMLGIPAALGTDATIHATCATDGTGVELRVVDGVVVGEPGIVHFLTPFRHWYDDIRHT